MNTKTLQTFGSIAGVALLLGGTFVSPASAKITTQVQEGTMDTRGGSLKPKGVRTLNDFINTYVTKNRFANLWGQIGTIVPASKETGNARLDIQNPPEGYANIQVQEGNATFATVLIPRNLAQVSNNPAKSAQQISELMNQVRKGLRQSVWSVRNGAPRIYKITGNFSN
jgi:hypothetical protein